MRSPLLKLFFLLGMLLVSTQGIASSQFLTDNASPLDHRQWEIYLYGSVDKNNLLNEEPDLSIPAIQIGYGIFSNIEIDLTIPYAWSLSSAAPKANGMGDLQIETKFRFIQETSRRPQVAFAPIILIPTGNASQNLGNGRPSLQLPIWFQKSWGAWTTYGGGGYLINRAQYMRNYFYAGWLLQKDINKRITLAMEIFTQGASAVDTRPYTIVNVGGYYQIASNFFLLMIAGHSIFGERHIFASFNLYWTGTLL